MAGNDVQSNVVLTADTSQYNQAMTGSAQQTDALAGSIDTLTAKVDRLAKSAGRKLIGVSAAETAGIIGATAAYASWEKQMTGLRVEAATLSRSVADQNRVFSEHARQVNSLRATYAQTTGEAAQLVQTIAKMSDNTTPVTQLERSFSKLGNAMGESSSSLASSMLQLQRTMGTSQRDTNLFNNQLAVLQSRSNAAASSILGFANNIAPVARMANISQTDIMGLSNAFIKAGQDGYMASNVFTRMITDIQQATVSGSPELNKYANLVGMTVDQFRQLGGTDQILSIFDAINRQGPQAITTLNRMGYDGMRTVRTITALAQQGGLRAEINAARGADTGALDRGNAAAMDTIGTQMKRFRIEVQQTAESIGSVFAGPAKIFFESLTLVAKGIHEVVDSPIGKLAAVVVGLTTPIAALAGTLLLAAKAMAAFAAANQLLNNGLTAGFREGRAAGPAGMAAAAEAGMAFGPRGREIAERGNWFNRGTYNTGAAASRFFPAREPGVTGLFSRAVGTAAGGAAWATGQASQMIYGAGAVRVPGMPMSGGYNDITRRPRLFSSPTLAGSFGWMNPRTWGESGDTLSNTDSRIGRATSAASAAMNNARVQAAMEAQRAEMGMLTRSLSTLRMSTLSAGEGLGRLSRSVVQAVTMIGATGVGAVRTGAGMAGRGLNALGFTPWMLAAGATLGLGMGAWKAMSPGTATSQDTSGFGTGYYQAGGIQTPPSAQTTFQQQQPAVTDMASATTVTPSVMQYAGSRNYKLANAYLKGMPQQQAMARLAVLWPSLRSNPQAVAALRNDLVNQYGATNAQAMLRQLENGVSPSISSLATPGGRTSSMFGLRENEKGATKNLDQFFGALQQQTNIEAQTISPESAWRSRGRNIAQGYQKFASGYVTETQSRAYEKEFAKNVLGIQQDINFSGTHPFDFGGVSPVAGRNGNNTFREFLIASAQGGVLSNATNRARAASNLGLDPNKTKDMSPTQFADAISKALTDMPGAKDQAKRQATTQDLLQKASASLFGVAGVLGDTSVQRALQNPGDINAQYQAAAQIARTTSGGGLRNQFSQLYGFSRIAGGDASMGSDLFAGGIGMAGQNQAYLSPYRTRTQQFGAATQRIGGVIDAASQGLSGGLTQQQVDSEMSTFAQSVQEQYNYFKQMLYQQREFNVSQSRAEQDFALQRSYAYHDFALQRDRAEHDFWLQRSRAEDDFKRQQDRATYDYNLSRKRQEEDHQHQVMLMVEQQAKAMYNMYERVRVQQTHSSTWLLVNANDQLQRMQKQEAQLKQLRGMGMSDDAIQQLNLTSPENQQQLSRFVTEVSQDPNLVKSFNEAVKSRLDAARALVTDQSSTDWQEFERSYNLSRDRAAEDFKRSMALSREDFKRMLSRQDTDFQTSLHRQQTDFATSMERQRKQYNTTMSRAAEDLARSAQTIDGNFETILSKAATKLGGHAAAQAATVLKQFSALKDSTGSASIEIMTQLAAIFGIDWKPPTAKAISNQAAKNNAAIMDIHNSMASGGVLPGFTPGRDVHHFYSPTGGALHLSGGEAIMVPEWVRAMGGEQAVQAMNHAARHGQSFAAGGVFKNPDARTSMDGEPVSAITKAQLMLAEKLSHSNFRTIQGSWQPATSYSGTSHMGPGVVDEVPGDFNTQYWMRKVAFAAWGRNFPGAASAGFGAHVHAVSRVDPGAASHPQLSAFARGEDGLGGKDYGPNPPVVANLMSLLGDFSNLSLSTGGGGGGSAGGSGSPLTPALRRRLFKALYPRVEAAAAAMVPAILHQGDASFLINRAVRKTLHQLEGGGFTGAAAPIPGAPVGSSKGPQGDVRKAANELGWGSQWPALYNLVMSESGFNPTAQNPTSTAYGMFQFLDGTWGSVGGHKTSDPWLQSVYGMRYIKNRYGDPNSAWAFHKSHGWYGDGAVFSGAQTIGIGERGPEAVIPLNDRGADFMNTMINKYGSGTAGKALNVRGSQPVFIHNASTYNIDHSTTFTGPINVTANNPGQLIAQLQQRQRVMAMANPALGGVKV